MANSPVQIVLNSSDFIEALENNGGGPAKDFFAGSDAEFREHRENLKHQLNEIKNMQMVSSFAKVSYAKVNLKQAALAKSHRPTTKLFKKDIAPVIGAGELGELFVELNPDAIDTISNSVGQAETETRYKENKTTGKLEPSPSRLKSEVGAIQEILPYTASDKRTFSTKDAVEWLSNPQTGGSYIIELFEFIPLRKDWDILPSYKFDLFQSFVLGLRDILKGLVVSRIATGDSSAVYGVKLEQSDLPAVIQLVFQSSSSNKNEDKKEIDLNVERHNILLTFLGNHPLVKKISLPPIVKQSDSIDSWEKGDYFPVPEFYEDESYPKICIVDGGVSDVYGNWVEERWGLISPTDKDENHGTFIAGLAIAGQTLNGSAICREVDGCKIIDLDILPKPDRYDTYFSRAMEFFDELESAVQDLKARTGVRIFNFSLNIEEHVSTTGYSFPAQILDRIAEENDIIFVISAGNTHPRDMRKEWPEDHFEALKTLASSRNDAMKKPAESCRNLSVAALNPPHLDNVVPYALSNYSCRGPGLRTGLKPDLAHVGGSGTKHSNLGHGLLSLDPSGSVVDGCGTSYAAPNVAKTLASLDHNIEGMVSRETLIALSVHHAMLPESMNDKNLRNVTKDLVGFGIPNGSNEILNGDPSAITLVFANRAISGHKMSFKFSWPPSLVQNGKCMGHAKLTIVSTPRLNYNYGSEFVRINIDAALRQMQKDGRYLGRLNAIYTPDEGEGSLYEKDLIEHSFKWSPVKVYEKTFPRGVGPTTEWKLDVEYLARDGVTIPREGVPFTAILTISDPTKQKPVFNDMRQMLQSLGVRAVDIKTAARVVPRV
ncbi:S8 family peptidase [Chryseobacterium sp. KMC2]|uniref:S8 family peptidase n=1 Tax=Chryseobacterium sp. KMC2 TaxID=2800705 RepID=UPI001922995D|nr:S8 family peptidase [Chryseobacterium sp. KMC2]MBL3547263.1 S8 family peptidase [Chryseobacterium sp. KMC2]